MNALTSSPPTRADRVRSVAVLVLAIAQVVSGGFAGASTGTISDANRFPVTPAGYAFTIWGLIYAASLVFAINQARPSRLGSALLRRTGWPVAVAFAAATIWVPVFGLRLVWLSQLIILVLLGALAVAVFRAARVPADGLAERALVRLPITLYLGWALLATTAGFGTTFRSLGLAESGTLVTAISVVLIALATLACVVVVRRATALAGFAFTAGWALVAIAVASYVPLVAVVAVVGLLVVVATLLVHTGRSADKARILLG